MKKILFFGLCIAVFAECNNPSEQRSPDANLFVDVETLLNRQVLWLNARKPAVNKTVMVNSQSEIRQKTVSDWEKELAVFKELNIGKPGLQASYRITVPEARTRLYTLKPSEHANVQWLRIEFEDDTLHIRRMEGMIKQTNYLYHSEKKLQIRFKGKTEEKWQVDDYQIDSKKKILFSDQEVLQIKGKIKG